MSIHSTLDNGKKDLCIFVEGRFDFSVLQPFRCAYENIPETPESYTVNLEKSNYIDSSALGMLLALRDHAGGDSAQIRITNCSNDIRKIFTITKLDELFSIE